MNSDKPPTLRQQFVRFVTEGIWDIEISSLSALSRIGVNSIRVIQLVFKGFQDNELPLHASALTYSTLLSIVPMLAFALAVLRGLGAGELAEQQIREAVSTMPYEFQQFVSNSLIYINKTNFAALGGAGLLLLLWAVVQVLGQVEMSFNRVWGVTIPRTLLRKFSDYVSVLVVVPVLIVAASTINATFSSSLFVDLFGRYIGQAVDLYRQMLEFTPLAATWLAFIFLYKFMPNTKVNMAPALISGLIGGSLWIGWQSLYISLQIGVSHYNAIYATFASIPIFLIWLYVSWQIVLLGAEIGFALQNHSTYKMEQRAHGASYRSRIMLALSIISHAAQSLMINVPHFEVSAYAKTHRVPVRLINEVTNELVKARLLAEISGSNGRYVLLKVPDTIRVKDVIQAISQAGVSPQSLGLDRLNPAIRHILDKSDAGVAEVLKEFSITDLLQMHSRLSKTLTPAQPKT